MKAGTKLGPYRIIESIGAGGMGEVFLAEDTTLGREIAIKTLPASLGTDAERLARFQQEARLLASVNHPNIATVYGLEKFDDVRFFTQELVRGETLAKRIERGAIEIREAIEIGMQIADALAAAHDAGVVHRDFKPSNAMLDEQGRIKVLDFGLAKPVSADDEEGGIQNESTPTISSIRPEGVILGTAAYMSPDQARGRMVDHRTDVWAFGCVLFECFTGERAFDGDTLLDTLANVVRGDADWSKLPADLPVKVRDLLRRCLQKKSRDRLHHLADARIELQEALEDPAPAATATHGAPARRVWPRLVATLLVGAALGALGSRLLPPIVDRPSRLSLAIPLGDMPPYDRQFSEIAVSPDGTRLVYAAGDAESSRLVLRALDAFAPAPIAGTEGAVNPFFSPDGQWIGFFASGKLMKVLVDGGVPQPICDVNVNSAGGAWLPDGTIVFGTLFTGSGLMRVSADGGEPEALTSPEAAAGEINHEWPRAIPGGNRVLFAVTTIDGPTVVALSLDSGDRRTVLQGTGDARYAPGGQLVYSQAGALFAVGLNPETFEVIGSPIRIVEGIQTTSTPARSQFAFGGNGTLVYAPGDVRSPQHEFVWVRRDGEAEPLPTPRGEYGHPRLSPDGRQVATNATTDEGVDIWVFDIERGSGTRLTRRGSNLMPVWSPDGESIAFTSNRGGPSGLHQTRADGGGEAVTLLQREVALWPRSWGPQNALLFYALESETGRDIWYLPMDAEGDAMPFLATPSSERSPAFSPDGRWVAYVSDESGRDEVYVRRFGEGGQRATISTQGGTEPVWAADGSELFYRQSDRMMVVRVETAEPFRVETPVALFSGPYATTNVGNQYYDVAADGRFLMIREGDRGAAPDHFRIVFDWWPPRATGATPND